MPIPTPQPGEKKDVFLAACMADPTMTTEYPDAPQRYAVCLAQWDKDRARKPFDAEPMSGWPYNLFSL
jgi:hypothetical protein